MSGLPATPPRRALILVGHGSHLSSDSSAPVHAHARRIRERGLFDEVLAAFWKEEPSLREAIALIESPEIFIVPLFLAEGYFTRQVVPRELGIVGPVTHREGKTIHYCAPVGTHSSMADLVVRRALEMPGIDQTDLSSTTLLIIGHGTNRSRTSGDTVYRLVAEIRARGQFGAVDCGFLDEDPRIVDVLAEAAGEKIVVVPFFLAEGWHTATTIPEEIGSGGEAGAAGPSFQYAPPIGTMPEIADVVMDLARAAGACGEAGDEDENWRASVGARAVMATATDGAPGTTAIQRRAVYPASDLPASTSRDRVPDAGVSAPGASRPLPAIAQAFNHFTARLSSSVGRSIILQVAIDGDGSGRYRLRHIVDVDTPSTALRGVGDLEELRDLVRFTAAGEYRPLRTRGDLRRGWVMDAADARTVWDALSVVYPAALLHWHRDSLGELEIVPFDRWAARQTGIYEVIREIPAPIVADVIETCCGSCLRRPLWLPDSGMSRSIEESESPADGGGPYTIPCREPCTFFATTAREAFQVDGAG